MIDKIEIFHNVLTKAEMNTLISDIKPTVSVDNMLYFNNKPGNDGIKKANCNNHPLIPILLDRLSLSKDQLDIASFLCYPTGSFNSPHSDNCIVENGVVTKIKPWTHSGIVYLNSEFIGGELIYPDQGCTFKPLPGICIISPAGEKFPHFVNKVVRGERMAIVLRLIL
jgi:hypothetical protein